MGVLTPNTDIRRRVMGVCPNFWVYYEVDQETRVQLLDLADYGQGGVGSWVLLESEVEE